MAIYTVHMPPASGRRLRDVERAVLLPEAFSWGAAIFGPIWLAAHRAWLAALAWLIAVALVVFAFEWLHLSRALEDLALLLIAVFFGFEGRALIRAKLERRGYRFADVVAAASERDAERTFFLRWFDAEEARPPSAGPRPGPAPPPEGEVLGLFPEPGGRR